MSQWLLPCDAVTPTWVKKESSLCHPSSILALLGGSIPLPVSIRKSKVVIWHSLKILKQFRATLGLQLISLFSPLTNNPIFLPSLHSSAFNTWHSKGVQQLEDLYIDNIFDSFSQLSQPTQILLPLPTN